MNTKYVFLDIDGTLVAKDGLVPESARAAIEQARANGHKIMICSGRSRCEMNENIMSVPLDGIVGSAGAYLEVEGKMIYHRPMTEEMNQKLFDYFIPKGIAIFVETNDELLVNDIGLEYIRQHIAYCEANDIKYDSTLFDLASPLSVVTEPEKLAINKVLYVTKKYDSEEIKKDLKDDFTVVDSAIALPGNSGELSELGMDKRHGIKKMIEYFGADMKDTIGIGDGLNDMAMLKTTAIGVAMGNANPVLKDVADYVTTDVEQDGIKNAFIHYGLIKG